MQLIFVNVGTPRQVLHGDRAVTTGIYKQPVDRPVRIGRLNLAGDAQADLSVHGGVDKAVYAYPHEHYDHWQRELGRDDLAPGQFGENLTTGGMLENEVLIGDVYRVGAARLQVSQPRTPCFKLGIRMGDAGFIKQFLQSLRVGFYLRVMEEGDVAAGDAIELVDRETTSLSIREVSRLMHFEKDDRAALERAARLPTLAMSWREDFLQRLE